MTLHNFNLKFVVEEMWNSRSGEGKEEFEFLNASILTTRPNSSLLDTNTQSKNKYFICTFSNLFM